MTTKSLVRVRCAGCGQEIEVAPSAYAIHLRCPRRKQGTRAPEYKAVK